MTLMEVNPDLKDTKDWNTRFPNTVSLYVAKFKIEKERVNKFIDSLRMIGDFEKHWDKEHPNEWIRYASMYAFPLKRELLTELIIEQKEIIGLIIPERRFMLLLIYTEDGKDYDRVPFRFNERLPMDRVISELKNLGICI